MIVINKTNYFTNGKEEIKKNKTVKYSKTR